VAALREKSRQTERELLELLRESSPEDGNGASRQAAVALTVERIRQKLPADALILEYFQVQGRLVVFLLSHSQMKFVSLADLSEVSTLMELLQYQLAKPHLGAEYVRIFGDKLLQSIRIHLENLYNVLIAPIRDWLSAAHLIIAPHGILHMLPFQALFDGARYLIEEFTVSYAPSASVYAVCQARSAPTENRSLILGIPDESVPLVQEEVQAVAGSLPNAELFLGEKATEECLRDMGQRSRFIHIATHGYFRRDSPMFSGIRLGDSYLSLYDLYQLRLPAELVALSGCSTGLNVVAAGDELLGLARGIIHAGAQTSLLTLWDVQDRSMAQLMKHFYEQLAGAENKAQALQKAMLLLKSEQPHPYYWAPLVLIGKM
jgi:CHAT domain-containing protein